ncbi:hypothetical protein GGF46_004825 [Coemansia sp. RSA 552]|nr:hypothetical protein GGF46_004825 [Coemansia sp. RSA 552]
MSSEEKKNPGKPDADAARRTAGRVAAGNRALTDKAPPGQSVGSSSGVGGAAAGSGSPAKKAPRRRNTKPQQAVTAEGAAMQGGVGGGAVKSPKSNRARVKPKPPATATAAAAARSPGVSGQDKPAGGGAKARPSADAASGAASRAKGEKAKAPPTEEPVAAVGWQGTRAHKARSAASVASSSSSVPAGSEAGKARGQARAKGRQSNKQPGSAANSDWSVDQKAEQRPPRKNRRSRPKPAGTQRVQGVSESVAKSGASATTGSGVATPKVPTPAHAVASSAQRDAMCDSGLEIEAMGDIFSVSGAPQFQAQALEPVADGSTQLVPTKVCVRWLPVDLPEHVFWRSAEPSLPWFSAEGTGAVVQRERLVLTAMLPRDNRPQDGDAEEKECEGDGEDSEGTAISRDGISPTDPTTAVKADVYESANLSILDSRPYWRQFVPGKHYRTGAKPTEPSRAYIVFATPSEAEHFYRGFHGHGYSKNGVQSHAQVEIAPFQGVPWMVEAAVDPLAGTIDDDPDFKAFLDPRLAEADTGPKPESHATYAAAAATSSSTLGADDVAVAATPLIQYLRELKIKSSSTKSAKAAAAQKKASARQNKAAGSRKAKEAPPKKGRRQDR